MKRLVVWFSVLFVVSLVLGGCSFTNPDKAAIKEAVLEYDWSNMVEETEFADSNLTSLQSVSSIPVKAVYLPIYDETTKIVKTIVIDELTGYATADVEIILPGELRLYNIYDELITIKDATLKGIATFTLKKVDEEWLVITLEMNISAGEDFPVCENVTYEPAPAVSGETLTVKATITNQAGDLFRVYAWNSAAMLGTPLWDYGVYGDEVQGDGIYTGKMLIWPLLDSGEYLGVLKAVAWGSFLDPEQPIKLTLQTFVIEVE